ncbi:hypothetical protein SLA2020_364920 [Shorea laevis]
MVDVENGCWFCWVYAELDLFPWGSPEISPVLRSAVDCYDLECWVEPVGKNLGAEISPRVRTARVHAGGGSHRKLLECLNHFKFEIDRAFGRVKEGWQILGLGLQPTSGHSGYKGSAPKPVKARKPKKLLLKPKPLSKPGCGSKPGLGRMVTVSSKPCLVAPVPHRRWCWFRCRLGYVRCAQRMKVALHPVGGARVFSGEARGCR